MGNRLFVLSVAAVLGWFVAVGAADEPSDDTEELIPVPTLGGKQFWADELFFHQWRIQRSVLSGSCRLLDGEDYRHASGTFDQCYAALRRIRSEQNLPPMQGKAVIAVHGLFRTRSSMAAICKYLQEEGRYTVFNISYPSTRRGIGGHTAALDRIISNLNGIKEINFVAHSMGNLVVRHYLADKTNPATGQRPDPRIKRFVMLGPPNHGSAIASILESNSMLDFVTGDAIRELGMDWTKLEPKLATPQFQFGIIAGGKGDDTGFSPILPGDDDGTITVASAVLAGAHDFLLVPYTHTFMMDEPKVQAYTLQFLQHGYFVSPEARRPIAPKRAGPRPGTARVPRGPWLMDRTPPRPTVR